MISLFLNLAAALNGYMRFYMPTNRAVDWLRTPRGLRWAIPVAIVATPAYLFAMSVCTVVTERGGSDYLNVLGMLFAWNALKFAVVGVLAFPRMLVQTLRSLGAIHPLVTRSETRQDRHHPPLGSVIPS
jgi:hypothetical protein